MDQETSTTDLPQPAAWRPVNRVLFRFIFVHLVLYIFPFPLNVLPYVDEWAAPYDNLWNWAVPWVGKHLFHVEITVLPNGSGDTTYNYVQIFLFAAIAAAAALVWSVLDRRRTQYTRLYVWLRIYVRFSLASAMISYGGVKIIKSRWRRIVFDRPVRMAIQAMSDTRRRFLFKQAPKSNVLTLTKLEDPKWKSTLSYTQTAPGLVAMEGTFDGRKIRARLRRADTSDFLLVSRGFHWINEYPLNH